MTRGRRSSKPSLLPCLLARYTCFPDGRLRLRHMRSYAVTELKKDVERELAQLPEAEREAKRTQFAVFVVHNKLKPKLAELPADMPYVS